MRLYRRILRIFPGFSAEYLENSFQNNLLTVVLIYSVTYTLVFELCASYLHLNKKRFEKLWLNFLILGYKTQFFALSYFLPKKMQNSPILCGLSSSEQTNYPELFPIRQSDILINRTRRFKIFSIVDLTVCVTKYLFTSLAFGKLLLIRPSDTLNILFLPLDGPTPPLRSRYWKMRSLITFHLSQSTLTISWLLPAPEQHAHHVREALASYEITICMPNWQNANSSKLKLKSWNKFSLPM